MPQHLNIKLLCQTAEVERRARIQSSEHTHATVDGNRSTRRLSENWKKNRKVSINISDNCNTCWIIEKKNKDEKKKLKAFPRDSMTSLQG